MWTSKALPLAAAALLALTGCATEPIETEGREESGAAPEPFERAVIPTETGDDDDNVAQPDGEVTFAGSIEVSRHATDGTYVMVDRAELEGREPGWVVIHASTDGAPGPVLGTRALDSALETRTVTDLRVELDEPLASGEQRVWVMLHLDAGTTGTYEFPGPDEPVAVDGEVVQEPVTVIVDRDGT